MGKFFNISCVIVAIYIAALYDFGPFAWYEKTKDLIYRYYFLNFKHPGLFTHEELATFNGETRPQLYLGFLGTIYNVSEARKLYGKDAPYHYFVGKDGTRAFATGDFKDESDNKDHIIDLTCEDLLGLLKWKDAIRSKYSTVGFLIGRYYNIYVDDTMYHSLVKKKMKMCLLNKQRSIEEDRKYPPCNVEWKVESGTRVWCTKSSGGIKRDWIGVPRKMYNPGAKKAKCVCVKDPEDTPFDKFIEYDDCLDSATSCDVLQIS